jgi:antitoxin component YwqK of YwqJK toxin-antitoxin module
MDSFDLGRLRIMQTMMKGLITILACGLLMSACTTQTPKATPKEQPPKTVLGKPDSEKSANNKEDAEPATIIFSTQPESNPKPTGLVYQDDTDIPFNGVKYFQFPDGKKMREVPYLNGKKHGPERRWYKNGNMYYEKSYWEGKLHGTVKEWDLNGELILHEQWLNGRMEKRIL